MYKKSSNILIPNKIRYSVFLKRFYRNTVFLPSVQKVFNNRKSNTKSDTEGQALGQVSGSESSDN